MDQRGKEILSAEFCRFRRSDLSGNEGLYKRNHGAGTGDRTEKYSECEVKGCVNTKDIVNMIGTMDISGNGRKV